MPAACPTSGKLKCVGAGTRSTTRRFPNGRSGSCGGRTGQACPLPMRTLGACWTRCRRPALPTKRCPCHAASLVPPPRTTRASIAIPPSPPPARHLQVVALWGDHGYALGDNDMWMKHANFEHMLKIPLMVHVPGPSRAKAAHRSLRRALLTPHVHPGSRYRYVKVVLFFLIALFAGKFNPEGFLLQVP